MASIYKRKGTDNYQISVVVGDQRVTHTSGTPVKAAAKKRAAAVQNLADALTDGEKKTELQMRRLCEAVFTAAGVASPFDVIVPPVPSLLDVAIEYCVKFPGALLTIQSLYPFVKHSEMPVSGVTIANVQAWYDQLVTEVAVGTARNRLVVLANFFSYAMRLGHITINPCAMVLKEKPKPVVHRQPLSDADFEKLTAFLCTDGPDHGSWLVAAMLGRYAGLRLMDAVNLRADAVQCNVLTYVPEKTEKPQCVPLVPVLREFLNRPGVRDCADLCVMLKGKSNSALSLRFSKLLVDAGVEVPRVEANGRSHAVLSFHSLRHSFVSWLARLGVPEHLRMKMSAHTTSTAHRVYDHSGAAMLAIQLESYLK